MTGILDHTGVVTELFQMAFKYVYPCDTLVDVGCGIRPQNIVKCKRHICVEPHGEYADILEKSGYEIIRKKANAALDEMEPVDTIIALDVLEHMEKLEGMEFIEKALQTASKQVVIFTPFGFMEQLCYGETDEWGLHGHEFQKHRSGWLPEEFPGWNCFVSNDFHNVEGKIHGAFIVVHTK